MKRKAMQSLIIFATSVIIAILLNYFFTKHILGRVGFVGAEYYIIALILQTVFIYEGILFFIRGWNINDKRLLSILYILITVVTLFFRSNHYIGGYDLNPLSFITNNMYYENSMYQIIVNIVLFMPFPIVVSFLTSKNKVIFFSFLICSFSVEAIQFLTHRGIFDLGDIVLYTIGFSIGLIVLTLMKPRLQRKDTSYIQS